MAALPIYGKTLKYLLQNQENFEAESWYIADHIFLKLIFFFFFLDCFSEKTRIDTSCESSPWQPIHLKSQVLFFSEKKKRKYFSVVCCSCALMINYCIKSSAARY